MGYSLSLGDGENYLNHTGMSWVIKLNLAVEYGWEPTGTEHPAWRNSDGTPSDRWVDPEDWDGSYFGNEGQYVTPSDAENLAKALERTIEKLPRNERSNSFSYITHLTTKTQQSGDPRHFAESLEQIINDMEEKKELAGDVFIRIIPLGEWIATGTLFCDYPLSQSQGYVFDVGDYSYSGDKCDPVLAIVHRAEDILIEEEKGLILPDGTDLIKTSNHVQSGYKKSLKKLVDFCRKDKGFYIF